MHTAIYIFNLVDIPTHTSIIYRHIDVKMPFLLGFEVMSTNRQSLNNLKIIILN
jgi:hypothetical protein